MVVTLVMAEKSMEVMVEWAKKLRPMVVTLMKEARWGEYVILEFPKNEGYISVIESNPISDTFSNPVNTNREAWLVLNVFPLTTVGRDGPHTYLTFLLSSAHCACPP